MVSSIIFIQAKNVPIPFFNKGLAYSIAALSTSIIENMLVSHPGNFHGLATVFNKSFLKILLIKFTIFWGKCHSVSKRYKKPWPTMPPMAVAIPYSKNNSANTNELYSEREFYLICKMHKSKRMKQTNQSE